MFQNQNTLFVIQNTLFANQMTQNTLFNDIYGEVRKNHNIEYDP